MWRYRGRLLFLCGSIDRLDHMTNTLLFQNALHALDRIAFTIEQMLDATEQVNIIRAVVSTTTATLHRLDL